MTVQEATKNVIKNTFDQPFDEARYHNFINNLLQRDFDDSEEAQKSMSGYNIPEAYKKYVKSYRRLGKYDEPNGKYIHVLVVHLNQVSNLRRARTAQRNFVGWYLRDSRGYQKDGALVAFHTEGHPDWRFSLVKVDYSLQETEAGKTRPRRELSPAKRFSYLVGANEPNHTAQKQLARVLDQESKPSLAELEEAFSVEPVSDEFFEQYRELFLEAKEATEEVLTADDKIRAEFDKKDITPTSFAKKLLGQIVFLYFIQKKGWLGVERDASGSFHEWGTGPKDFLRRLFAGEYCAYDNFYNDVLEHLFYNSLAVDRGRGAMDSKLECRIPFLNGGLFEPINNYAWDETELTLPDELFAEIFDTFDRYNFTIREDEPLEKEVAVDPEMLGKVYERMLDVEDRKSKGAFYTPREIVHYMCQESLVNYLSTHLNNKNNLSPDSKNISSPSTGEDTGGGESSSPSMGEEQDGGDSSPPVGEGARRADEGDQTPSPSMEEGRGEGESSSPPVGEDTDGGDIPEADIRLVVEHGDLLLQHEAAVAEGDLAERQQKIPDSIRERVNKIDALLAEIKVCDPAIGSGAFPVGLMQEIVKLRRLLTPYLDSGEDRSQYELKRHAILHNLYGVDIDPSSVDIAKLRLWLSLVVDEEDYEEIKPLPNLEYRIMQGDSLVEEYEGIELFDSELIRDRQADTEARRRELKEKQRSLEKQYIDRHQSGNLPSAEQKRLDNELEKIKKEIGNLESEQQNQHGTPDLFQRHSEARKKAEELDQLQKEFADAVRKSEKRELREEIEELHWELIEATLEEHDEEEKLKELEEIKQSRRRPFFLWELYFTEVFLENNGFDVVIANPPYVRQEDLGEQKEYFKNHYETYYGTADFYTYFIERGYKLLNQEGTFCYIVSNKWMRAKYGKNLRSWLDDQPIRKLINFGDYTVFDTATTYPCILMMSPTSFNGEFTALDVANEQDDILGDLSVLFREDSFPMNKEFLTGGSWTLVGKETQDLLRKVRDQSKPLKKVVNGGIHYGIKTGLNKAFVIDSAKYQELIDKNPASDERLKPFLKGRDIKRYASLSPEHYLIFFPNGWTNENAPKDADEWQWLKQQYPAITGYLSQYEERARERYDQGEYWWELRACDYYDEFEKPKLIVPDIAERGNFTLDRDGNYYCVNTAYIISSDDPYLLGLLNSKLLAFYYENICSSYRGGYLRYIYQYMEQLPIKQIDESNSTEVELRDQIAEKADRMLSLHGSLTQVTSDSEKLNIEKKIEETDQEIDRIVYELYGLTNEEIQIIEDQYD